jgi:hypothetical protein
VVAWHTHVDGWAAPILFGESVETLNSLTLLQYPDGRMTDQTGISFSDLTEAVTWFLKLAQAAWDHREDEAEEVKSDAAIGE